MKFKQCIIMRGASGSGKSTFAKQLASRINAKIVSADNHFLDKTGTYSFDAQQLPQAHGNCFSSFMKCLQNGEHVIVDNTNARARDAQQYVDAALDAGYDITIIEMVTPIAVSASRNVHGVDAQTIERQNARMTTPIAGDNHVIWRIDGASDIDDSVNTVVDHLL